MSVKTEIQLLAPTAIVELFEIDMTSVGAGIGRFHAGTNELQQHVVWQNVEYIALPVEAEGFDVNAKGTLPRPKVRVANIDGIFSAAVRQSDDLIGCKLTRKRTFVRFLDAVNFPGGNPSADPNQHLEDDIWFIDQKISENRYVVEWELASAFDLQGVMLPYRQVIQNACPWRYRSGECGWTGGYVDTNDNPTPYQEHDFCAKRLSSCKARFGGGVLPFGGFPGAMRGY